MRSEKSPSEWLKSNVSVEFLTFVMAQGKMTGTCIWFNSEKRYGFITCDDGSGDLFVHATNIHGNGLQKGDKVEFDIKEHDGRKNAVNVTGPDGEYIEGQERSSHTDRATYAPSGTMNVDSDTEIQDDGTYGLL